MLTKVSANREGMSISLKHTHEIATKITGKNVNKAIEYLQRVLEKRDFVPFKRYPSKSHKAGVPAGYPVKATKSVISILKELKANAKNAGGESEKMIISGYALGRGGYPRYSGGRVYRHGKRTNLRIFGDVEKSEKPKVEALAQTTEAAPQTVEVTTNVTKENN